MQTKAALMVLVLLSGTIAGCTSDPDGGGNDGIDSDALDDLFDQYFEDFVNNTSITVNNHYYNNSTYVVDDGDYSSTTTTNIEYNNTTNVDGGEINNYNTDNSVSNINGSGVGSASIMQMFTVNWAHTEVQIPNFGNRIVTLNDTLQQTSGNPNLLYALVYEGNLIEFEDVNCEQFYNFAWMSVDQWEDHLIGIYGYGSGDSYWPARDLRDFWSDNAYHDSSSNPVNAEGETVQDQCPGIDGGADESYYLVTVFEIELFT
ncbi:MAG TPA: hypothetical protein HA288_02390, partial [Candidatus Thalassarchaeum sp.]|nr:hypothetical protein [Candidatus Thalassarchaeum sp.]